MSENQFESFVYDLGKGHKVMVEDGDNEWEQFDVCDVTVFDSGRVQVSMYNLHQFSEGMESYDYEMEQDQVEDILESLVGAGLLVNLALSGEDRGEKYTVFLCYLDEDFRRL